MNHFKMRLFLLAALALVGGLISSCSPEETPVPPTPEPPAPPIDKVVTLTQLSASLSDPTVITRASNPEEANVMKTAFVGGDFFQFTYNAPKNEGMQVAYAHTTDGKAWAFRKTADASGAAQTVNIDPNNTALKAAYLPLAAGGAVDGIVLGADNTLTCYDALQALADAAISGESAAASLKFTHVNHLLRFSISGSASAVDVTHLLLTISYKDATNNPVTATMKTAFHTEYTAVDGGKLAIIQAIVPREAILQGITAVFSSGKLLVANDPEHSSANLDCPGGKSRLISLTVSDDKLTMQPGDISAGWADGGTINSDGQLAGDLYISSVADLKAFRDAVNANPESSAAKINGIFAYTANVVQTADIDLSGENWTPIGGARYNDGSDMTNFVGTYNGNGYTISNMTVTTPTGNGRSHYAGLFGWVKSPNDRNVVLVGIHLRNASVNVTQNTNNTLSVGTLVGRIDGNEDYPTVVSLCSATGSVSANSTATIRTGGLVGSAKKAHITRCTVNVSATATGGYKTDVGGIAGDTEASFVISCYARGAVSITQNLDVANAGGIVGYVGNNDESNFIMSCRADGNVTAAGTKVNAGGLVGLGIGTLGASFAKGTVTGTPVDANNSYIGAIIGQNFSSDKLSLCYGTSAGGVGTSNGHEKPEEVVYNQNPGAGEILGVVNPIFGSALVQRRALTPVSLFASGSYTTRVELRFWLLGNSVTGPSVWTDTSQGGTDVYPVPEMNYMGQQF